MANSKQEPGAEPVNLDDVQRLVDALERDLAKVRAGAAGVDSLREEVEAQRSAQSAAEPREEHVRERLHGVRSTLEDVGETLYEDAVKLGDYLARIGRMLGL
jgi:hypothetical protein